MCALPANDNKWEYYKLFRNHFSCANINQLFAADFTQDADAEWDLRISCKYFTVAKLLTDQVMGTQAQRTHDSNMALVEYMHDERGDF